MEHSMYFGNESWKSMMEKTPSFIQMALRYMEEIRKEIIRKFKMCDKDEQGEKREIEDQQHRCTMRIFRMEMLMKFKQREEELLMESIAKLEKENNDAKRQLQEAMKTKSPVKLINQSYKDVLTERGNQTSKLARIIMNKLEEHKISIQKIQEELITEVKERKELHCIREKCHQELMVRLKEREALRHVKEESQKELVAKIKEKQVNRQSRDKIHLELKKRFKERERLCSLKEAFQRELMSYHKKRLEDLDNFIPRKLFLFKIDSFICAPLTACEPQTEKKEVPVKTRDDSGQVAAALPPKAKKNPCQNLSFASRLKKFFRRK